MSRYRKVEVSLWADERFRSISQNAQYMYLFLLTGPHTGPIPGLFKSGELAMSEELGWEPEAFREAFREVFQQGLAKADWKARVVWIPDAIEHNLPQSPNVIKSWKEELKIIPECALKNEALQAIRAALEQFGNAYLSVFDEISSGKPSGKPSAKPSAKPSGKPSGKPCPNQEQYQKQKQEQEQKEKSARAKIDGSLGVASKCEAIRHDWEPASETCSILERAGINRDFIAGCVDEFRMYWTERGDRRSGFDAAFMSSVKRQWAHEAASKAGLAGKREKPSAVPEVPRDGSDYLRGGRMKILQETQS